MSAHRRLIVPLLLIAFLVAPLDCRRADGGAEDPVDREGRDAFVSYLKIDTTNPPGHETAGAKFLQQLLQKEGIEARLVGSDPERQSVYARLRSGSNDKALLLLHHIDVVPALAAEWTKAPFAGTIAEGYIWGRGALDVKSLGIAEAMAIIELKRRKVPLRRNIVFLGVAGEETGGAKGSQELLEKNPQLFDNVGFVINEGGYSETIVDHVAFWGIEVQEKVPLWLALHARGTAGHAASPPDDGGAVAKLVRALAAVEQIPTPYRLTPDVERYFHQVGATRHDERGEVLLNIAGELNGSRIGHVLTPSYRSLLHDTIDISLISGGTSVNSLPANASAEIDIRILPDEQTGPMLESVRAAAGKDAEVEVLLAGAPAPATSEDTDLYRSIERVLQRAEPSSRVAPIVGAGTTDSRFFRARGIAAYGVSPFKVNYYDAGTAHGIDERIRVRFFEEGVRLMRAIVSDFCERQE
jgi:acetylornithine deacetylase/succinyl-diaminopimelate desuccinylase-like protein